MNNWSTLLPELGDRPSALTTAGLFLVRVGKGSVAVFTSEELRTALKRGKAVLRSRTFNARCRAEREKAGEKWLKRILDQRGFITAEELLRADLGNGPNDSGPQGPAEEKAQA